MRLRPDSATSPEKFFLVFTDYMLDYIHLCFTSQEPNKTCPLTITSFLSTLQGILHILFSTFSVIEPIKEMNYPEKEPPPLAIASPPLINT